MNTWKGTIKLRFNTGSIKREKKTSTSPGTFSWYIGFINIRSFPQLFINDKFFNTFIFLS